MALDVKIDIDAVAVNKMVSDAILESVIGEELKASIKKAIEGLTYKPYSSSETALDKVVTQIVLSEAAKLLHDEYRGIIREQIKTRLTDEAIDKLVDSIWHKWDESVGR